MLAEIEDLDDVRVVHPGRRPGLVAESCAVQRPVSTPRVQDFQGDVSLERLALRSIHNTHATRADYAKDPVITQPLGRPHDGRRRCVTDERAGQPAAARLVHLDLDEGRKQLEDLPGERGVTLGVLGQARPFTVPQQSDERLGQAIEVLAVGRIGVHGRRPSPPSGLEPIRSFSRVNARM